MVEHHFDPKLDNVERS